MGDKKSVKVRLGEKWAKGRMKLDGPPVIVLTEELTDAYVAGFDRAKALCIDFTQRYVDRRTDPPFSEDEEKLWLTHFPRDAKTRQPSEHMAAIGEMV